MGPLAINALGVSSCCVHSVRVDTLFSKVQWEGGEPPVRYRSPSH